MNSRTLHDRIVPRGGGVVVAAVCIAAILAGWLAGLLSMVTMLAIGIGGLGAASLGFIDDVHDVRASRKFVVQLVLAVWLVALVGAPLFERLPWTGLPARAALAGVLVFVPVWLMNLFNFIDGIDGLATSASVLTAVVVALAVALSAAMPLDDRGLALVPAAIFGAALGFFRYNRPQASIFLGDAGSVFLGYSFAALMLTTIGAGYLSVWTWIATLGYYIADTTTTTICRMIITDRWYATHRSHAYQNLARVGGSHARVTYGISAYQLLWSLPLAVWSITRPDHGPIAAVLALLPAVLWTLRYGPPFSKD